MKPLSERMRPQSLDFYFGQGHLIGEGRPLRAFIDKGIIPSLIFWGEPGIGKTTLATIIANKLTCPFYSLSAIDSGVKEVRSVIAEAKKKELFSAGKPILFIDEIHRFSKSQQDALLGAVEQGVLTLIGATTENPSFEVVPALLSRCQLYVLKSLTEEDLKKLFNHTITTDTVLQNREIKIDDFDALIRYSNGDARRFLNLVEAVVNMYEEEDVVKIDNDIVSQVAQQQVVRYDKKGEAHYDVISAFIKAIRGSDPDAAVYWLARMIVGGEEAKFIARRLVISAAEDIGMANPTALVIANNCFDAVHNIGMPEARIVLSQATIYLATSAKSNAAYLAIDKAIDLVNRTGNLPIPLHLRNAPTKMMKSLGYGKGYKYPHDFPNNYVKQQYLPDEIKDVNLGVLGNSSKEKMLKNALEK